MKKNVVIDGDKFQKEYKEQYQKELLTDLIQGIIITIIAVAGLFFGSNLLLKLVIYIFPILIMTYAVNLFSMGLPVIKVQRNQGISFFVQAALITLLALYILFNPIDSLGFVLIILGALIIANAVIKMIYFPNYLPISSFICGGLLMLFSEALINLFYMVVMIFLLIYGVSKIGRAIYVMKNK